MDEKWVRSNREAREVGPVTRSTRKKKRSITKE